MYAYDVKDLYWGDSVLLSERFPTYHEAKYKLEHNSFLQECIESGAIEVNIISVTE